jgi:hypothetical protein
VACRLAALRRRLDDELAAGTGPGLQRSGPHPRRERQRRGWVRGRQCRVRRRGRHPAAVHRRAGPRDLVAAARGADRADRAGRPHGAPAATGFVRRRCCGAAGRW